MSFIEDLATNLSQPHQGKYFAIANYANPVAAALPGQMRASVRYSPTTSCSTEASKLPSGGRIRYTTSGCEKQWSIRICQ